MNSSRCPCSADIAEIALPLGFHSVGVASVGPVHPEAVRSYARWIAEGMNASMDYMARYGDVRDDPSLLLEGARSVIVCTVNYHHPVPDGAMRGCTVASYAHGDDYHEVVRRMLVELAEGLKMRFGGEFRAVVDTAPLRERYWAQKAGVGFVGRNSQLIVPGAGSYFFIGTLISTVSFLPDAPCAQDCIGCMRCESACPGKAIDASRRRIDARRCLSYLTIEHRGDLPDAVSLSGHLYGCDECQRVCPHNAGAPFTRLSQFELRPAIAALTPEKVVSMTQEEFSAIFRHSAVKRAKLAGLRRNALRLIDERDQQNK